MWPSTLRTVVTIGGLALLMLAAHAGSGAARTLPTCPIHSMTRPSACRDPLNGLGVFGGSPVMRTEMPAVTARFAGDIVVKAAVRGLAIPASVRQVVWGQVLVHHTPIRNVLMQTTWHFTGGVRQCTARADRWGVGGCSERSLQFGSTDGDRIPVVVKFAYRGRAYACRIVYTILSD